MRKTIAFTLIAALMFMASSTSLLAEDVTKFIRFTQGETPGTGALQIAYATYKSEKSNVTITLYGVVHIADMAYYNSVQSDLDKHDVVLYELVKPGKNSKIKPSKSVKGLGQMQKLMGELLGLSFQKDGINYKSKNFVHADMTFEELQKASGGDMSKILPGGGMFSPKMMESLGPMLKMAGGFLKKMMANNPSMRNNLKLRFAQQMTGATKQMSGEMQRVIVVERNKKAMTIFDRELAKLDGGSMAIFYGAAHNADFHKRLVARGFKQTSKTWKNAWNIGLPTGKTPKAERVAPKPNKPTKKAPKVEFYK